MSALEEIRSLAESPFPKEKADLVILGIPDSSGVPVSDRMFDICEEHRVVDYRLVPVETLREVVALVKALQR